MQRTSATGFGVLTVALALSGCATSTGTQGPNASAELEATKGNTARGTVSFRQTGERVRVQASVSGLTPGPHGFHIHDQGDCSSGDGASAGGHFNPLAKPHAHPQAAERHAGDLPQLTADAAGKATLDFEIDLLRIGTGPTNIVGRSVIVHGGPDDFKSQPAGNSGPRVACGVIRAG